MRLIQKWQKLSRGKMLEMKALYLQSLVLLELAESKCRENEMMSAKEYTAKARDNFKIVRESEKGASFRKLVSVQEVRADLIDGDLAEGVRKLKLLKVDDAETFDKKYSGIAERAVEFFVSKKSI